MEAPIGCSNRFECLDQDTHKGKGKGRQIPKREEGNWDISDEEASNEGSDTHESVAASIQDDTSSEQFTISRTRKQKKIVSKQSGDHSSRLSASNASASNASSSHRYEAQFPGLEPSRSPPRNMLHPLSFLNGSTLRDSTEGKFDSDLFDVAEDSVDDEGNDVCGFCKTLTTDESLRVYCKVVGMKHTKDKCPYDLYTNPNGMLPCFRVGGDRHLHSRILDYLKDLKVFYDPQPSRRYRTRVRDHLLKHKYCRFCLVNPHLELNENNFDTFEFPTTHSYFHTTECCWNNPLRVGSDDNWKFPQWITSNLPATENKSKESTILSRLCQFLDDSLELQIGTTKMELNDRWNTIITSQTFGKGRAVKMFTDYLREEDTRIMIRDRLSCLCQEPFSLHPPTRQQAPTRQVSQAATRQVNPLSVVVKNDNTSLYDEMTTVPASNATSSGDTTSMHDSTPSVRFSEASVSGHKHQQCGGFYGHQQGGGFCGQQQGSGFHGQQQGGGFHGQQQGGGFYGQQQGGGFCGQQQGGGFCGQQQGGGFCGQQQGGGFHGQQQGGGFHGHQQVGGFCGQQQGGGFHGQQQGGGFHGQQQVGDFHCHQQGGCFHGQQQGGCFHCQQQGGCFHGQQQGGGFHGQQQGGGFCGQQPVGGFCGQQQSGGYCGPQPVGDFRGVQPVGSYCGHQQVDSFCGPQPVVHYGSQQGNYHGY